MVMHKSKKWLRGQVNVHVGPPERTWQDLFLVMDVTHSFTVNWDDYYMFSKYNSYLAVTEGGLRSILRSSCYIETAKNAEKRNVTGKASLFGFLG